MGKPQIIGYESDPNATVGQLWNAERWSMHFDSFDGDWLELNCPPYSVVRLTNRNRTPLMRELGFRPVYRERDFKATLYSNREGCSIRCRKCGYRWSTVRLPHDSARLHETGYCSALQGRGAIPRIVADE